MKLQIDYFQPEQRQMWDSFVESSNNPLFFFKRSFIESQTSSVQEKSLCVFSDDKLCALLPGSISNDTYFSYGGLTYGGLILPTDSRNFEIKAILQEVIRFLSRQKFKFFLYKPVPFFFQRRIKSDDTHFLWAIGALSKRRELTSVIDLRQPIVYSKGRRSSVSKAKKFFHGISEVENTDEIYFLLESVLEKNHGVKPVHSKENLNYIKKVFPQNVHFFCVKDGQNIVSLAIVFDFGDVFHAQYLATSEEGKQHGALDFLLDALIHKALDQEKKYFSFGISTEHAGKVVNDGLILQKESFGSFSATLETLEVCLSNEVI